MDTDTTGTGSTEMSREKISHRRSSTPKVNRDLDGCRSRGPAGPGVLAFAGVVADYREALTVLGALPAGGALHAQASAVEEALRDRCFKVTVACLLCAGPVDHEFTVTEFAALCGAPRGICGAHGLDEARSEVDILLA